MLSSITSRSPRTVLRLDGALCLAMGTVLIAMRAAIAGPTGLPTGFLLAAGVLLLPVGLFILAVAWPPGPPRSGVAIVVIGNALWVQASIGVLAVGFVQPTLFGAVLILGQAVAVAVIAAVEALPLSQRQATF
jgi:predicted membrane channel-forming protein YqfA (hemolysin III family)